MNKLALIALVVLAFAGIATASAGHTQCTPEPITMFGLIPGIAMLLRRKNKA